MGQDLAGTKLVEFNDVFADVYNNLYFEGNQVIREEHLEAMPTRAYTKDASGNLRGRMRDVRKKCTCGGEYQLILGYEHQSGVDNTMPVRMMGYEYAAYEEQIDQIRDQNKKDGRDAGAKRIFRNQKLEPVTSCVLYYGDKKWIQPMSLHDMLNIPEEMPDVVKEKILDFPIHVIQVAYLMEEERERLTSDFRVVAEYLACDGDFEKWKEFVGTGDWEVRHVEALLDFLGEISRDERFYKLLERIRETGEEEEEWKMCKILDEYERIGVERGRKEGHKEGREEGRKEGEKEAHKVSLQIQRLIRDGIKSGIGESSILDEVVNMYSISRELASEYYEVAVGD